MNTDYRVKPLGCDQKLQARAAYSHKCICKKSGQ